MIQGLSIFKICAIIYLSNDPKPSDYTPVSLNISLKKMYPNLIEDVHCIGFDTSMVKPEVIAGADAELKGYRNESLEKIAQHLRDIIFIDFTYGKVDKIETL